MVLCNVYLRAFVAAGSGVHALRAHGLRCDRRLCDAARHLLVLGNDGLAHPSCRAAAAAAARRARSTALSPAAVHASHQDPRQSAGHEVPARGGAREGDAGVEVSAVSHRGQHLVGRSPVAFGARVHVLVVYNRSRASLVPSDGIYCAGLDRAAAMEHQRVAWYLHRGRDDSALGTTTSANTL